MKTASFAHRAMLKPYIREGKVDYQRLANAFDTAAWAADIAGAELSDLGRDEQLAFYLNAYNLLTVQQVLERLAHNPDWPGPVSLLDKLRFFYLRTFDVAGQNVSLFKLENTLIRKKFAEPRIHFAINCGSSSCPHLPGSLFIAESLEADLDMLTRQFIESDEVHYDAATETLFVSQIFKWYRRDFSPSAIDFIRQYRDVPARVNLRYLDYDWRLNGSRS